MSTSDIETLKGEILSSRNRIRTIVESVQTSEQLESCERMLTNWEHNIQQRLDSFKPAFFFRNTACWRSAFELYLRVKKAHQCSIAQKKSEVEPGVHYYKCSVTLEEELVNV